MSTICEADFFYLYALKIRVASKIQRFYIYKIDAKLNVCCSKKDSPHFIEVIGFMTFIYFCFYFSSMVDNIFETIQNTLNKKSVCNSAEAEFFRTITTTYIHLAKVFDLIRVKKMYV